MYAIDAVSTAFSELFAENQTRVPTPLEVRLATIRHAKCYREIPTYPFAKLCLRDASRPVDEGHGRASAADAIGFGVGVGMEMEERRRCGVGGGLSEVAFKQPRR